LRGALVSDSERKIIIIGIGADGMQGLTAQARQCLTSANLLVGAEPVLNLVGPGPAERARIGPDLQDTVRLLESNAPTKRIVVLAGGDPLFYGVARYLCDRLGKDRFEVLPHVSTMQLAFARVKESWEEAYLTNLANHPLDEVLDRIRTAETVGLFTAADADPPAVARQLLARGIDYFWAYVCENLGGPDERVTHGELAEVAEMEFAPLNVMILKRKAGRPDLPRALARFRRFGNPDDVFTQARPKSGLITQAEVRAIALAQLDIHPGDVVWDIGAGSGSVAIECAQLSAPGIVHAIEQDAADFHLILANAGQFGVKNLKAVHGTAPAVLGNLPAPDAIFVGGTGKEVTRIMEAAYASLRRGGRMVVNVATLESLTTIYATLKTLTPGVQVLLVNIARGVEQLETLRFEAVNPTFVLAVTKPA
jgi:precorrin-6B C5,15-methyltransferase / cobalt-precorrin-6B C5,C15-methyltransferase